MQEYDFVALDTDWGTGYSLFGGVRIDTNGHREIIARWAAEGWRYVGFLPKRQRAAGFLEIIDMVFERERPES